MKKIKIKKGKFNFDGLVQETAKTGGVGKEEVCFIIDSQNVFLKYPNDYKEVKSELEKGNKIFVFFAGGLELDEDGVYKSSCADGDFFEVKKLTASSHGESDLVGYLVSLEKDDYVFESYLCEAPIVCHLNPTFKKYSVKELDHRMEKFLKKFTT